MVFVSHNMTQVKSFCDRSIWLYEGKIRMDDTTENVAREYLKDQGIES